MRRRPSRRHRAQPEFLTIPGARGVLGQAVLGIVIAACLGLWWLLEQAWAWLISLAS